MQIDNQKILNLTCSNSSPIQGEKVTHIYTLEAAMILLLTTKFYEVAIDGEHLSSTRLLEWMSRENLWPTHRIMVYNTYEGIGEFCLHNCPSYLDITIVGCPTYEEGA